MRRPDSALLISAAFLLGAVVGGAGHAVLRIFYLGDFDPKFRDVPSLAFQLELYGVALIAVLGSVVLLLALLIERKLRSGSHPSDRRWIPTTVGGLLYIPVVTWIVDLPAGPLHPESVLVSLFRDGGTALHLAVEGDHRLAVERMLAGGISANARDDHGATPLHRASRYASVPTTAALLEAGAEVDATNRAGQTPLLIAVEAQRRPLVPLLLE